MEAFIFILWLATIVVFGMWDINMRKPPEIKEQLPICGCDHHLCYHNADGCQAMHGGCGCQKYIQQDTPANAALYGDELAG